MMLNIISGNQSRVKNNIPRINCIDNIQEDKFYCIKNITDHKKLITKLIRDNTIPINSLEINPNTHAYILKSIDGSTVQVSIINESLSECSKLLCEKLPGKEKLILLEELTGTYIEPGYRFKTTKGIVVIIEGKGIYSPNSSYSEPDNPSTEFEKISLNVDFNLFGIGGLKTQMDTLIRQALIGWIIDPKIRELYELKTSKGILLYGPPGTGKTTIAKNISHIIPNTVVKKINGPEVLNKYVGESESNIRKLFEDAKNDYDKKGKLAKLHIIIFDEIDSLGSKRGGSESTHKDGVLNQILTMIDGLDSVPNILIIGITNRKDLLDSALIRAGRLECHIYVPLPDFDGRKEILNVYLKPLKQKGLIDHIDLDIWSQKLDGFSGADIESLINRAKNIAIMRTCDISDTKIISRQTQELEKITPKDLELSFLEFNGNDRLKDELVNKMTKRFITYPSVNHIIESIKYDNLNVGMTYVINIVGDRFTGKTSLACQIAKNSKIPYIKYCSYEHLLGESMAHMVYTLDRIYQECIMSNRSILILDNIDVLNSQLINLKISSLCTKPINDDNILIIIIIGETEILPNISITTPNLTSPDIEMLNTQTGKSKDNVKNIREYFI